MIHHDDIDNGPVTSRMHKGCCCSSSLCCACNMLFQPCRKAVSGNKRRIRKDGYDLDMAYIAPRIIIHGFPAAGLEHMYRNPRYEVKRYMEAHHKDHYKVYNFCCEFGRGYDPSVFNGRVERYPFKDHNTPPLESMVAFANSVKAWLDADPLNVVNMHCKAGKGRAGLMGCVALIRTGVAQSAEEALEIYDRERVTNNKGLTVTSQRKFVKFYERLWRDCWNVEGNIGDIPAEEEGSSKYVVPEQPSRRLYGIDVVNLPAGMVGSARVRVYKITNFLPECIYDSKVMKTESISLDVDVMLKGNFKVAIESKNGGIFTKHVKLMELLHNTYFMDWTAESIDFDITQLDTKKKIRPKLGADIAMRLRFVQSSSQLQAAGGSTGKGYELVTADEDNETGVAGGDVELSRAVAAVKASDAPTVSSEKAAAAATDATVPMKTETSSKKNSAAAAAPKFTSLMSSSKSHEDTNVTL